LQQAELDMTTVDDAVVAADAVVAVVVVVAAADAKTFVEDGVALVLVQPPWLCLAEVKPKEVFLLLDHVCAGLEALPLPSKAFLFFCDVSPEQVPNRRLQEEQLCCDGLYLCPPPSSC
jgi:hypothetical protein